jgi:hypothetical protein
MLERSNLNLSDYNEDDCKPEMVLNICNNLYGSSNRIDKGNKLFPDHHVLGKFVTRKWNMGRINIEYLYLPLIEFDKIKNSLPDDYLYWYNIVYSYLS